MNNQQMRTYGYTDLQRPVPPLKKHPHSGVLHVVQGDDARTARFVGYATVLGRGFMLAVWRNVGPAGDVWPILFTPQGENQCASQRHSGTLRRVTGGHPRAPAFTGYATVLGHGFTLAVWRNIGVGPNGGDVCTLVLREEEEGR